MLPTTAAAIEAPSGPPSASSDFHVKPASIERHTAVPCAYTLPCAITRPGKSGWMNTGRGTSSSGAFGSGSQVPPVSSV